MLKRKHEEIVEDGGASPEAAPPVDNQQFKKATPEEIKARV